MDQKKKLTLRSFRRLFFIFSGGFLVFAWAAWSQPILPTICIIVSVISCFFGFHAWWRMRKQAKKDKIVIEPEVLN